MRKIEILRKFPLLVQTEIRQHVIKAVRYPVLLVSGLALAYGFFIAVTYGVSHMQSAHFSLARATLTYLTWYYAIGAISSMSILFGEEAMEGTLEQLFMSPIPPILILTARAIAMFFFNTLQVLVMLLLIRLTLGLHLDIGAGITLCLLGVTVISFYGFGYALAGMTLVFKRIGQVAFLIQVFLLFMVMAPKDSLPGWAGTTAGWLPMVKGIDLINLAADGSIRSLGQLPAGEWTTLLLTTAGFVAAGIAVYLGCERFVRRENLLGQH